MCNICVCILAQIATVSNYQSMRMDACENRKKMHSFASEYVCTENKFLWVVNLVKRQISDFCVFNSHLCGDIALEIEGYRLGCRRRGRAYFNFIQSTP